VREHDVLSRARGQPLRVGGGRDGDELALQRRRRLRHEEGIVTVLADLVAPPPVLRARGLSRRFGPGCPQCVELTGEVAGTNRCRACGTVVALHDVSFDVGPGEVVGVVGESGSGKTTLLRTLYLDGAPDAGEVELLGEGDLLRSERPAVDLRRSLVVMVHQNALAAGLHPRLAAEANVAERLLATGSRSFRDLHVRAGDMLAELEVQAGRHSDPLATFSGGMQQRVQLARALVDPPPVLLLDEPTTGLDPSVQAGLLDVVQRVADAMAGATIVVSHDLGVVRVLAARVVVLHHGRVVEEGLTEQILEDPQHAYTQLLVSSRL
jgi:putative phosphonate transport system ATP-binding protein